MRFWDASALVPLLLEEPASAGCRALLADDPRPLVWWGTELECVSAVGRLEREGVLDAEWAEAALARLDALRAHWDEVQPVNGIRSVARRLLRLHPLCTADALQLAAAIACAEDEPSTLPFVCLDRRLAAAARREGFVVVVP